MKCEPRRARKPDAQPFDEIRIVTVPRYKTSGMSGDEWRISARTQFLRKGKVVAEFYNSSTETACMFLPGRWFEAIDDGKGYYAGEGNICDQEGCAEEATVTLRLKKQFCHQGHELDPDKFVPEGLIRRFCKRHSRRGDCGLEDADRNYTVLEGEPSAPQPEDVKPSTFGGVVDLLGEEHTKMSESRRIPEDEPYFVEVDKVGCSACGQSTMWTVIGPDGSQHSESWEDGEEAANFAECMNEAYANGRASALSPQTPVSEPESRSVQRRKALQRG